MRRFEEVKKPKKKRKPSETVIKLPKFLNVSNMFEVLSKCSRFFTDEFFHKLHFDFSNVKGASLLGKMIIFKIVNYCSQNKKFNSASITFCEELKYHLAENGFDVLFEALLSGDNLETQKAYEKIKKVKKRENMLIVPQRLIRSNTEEMNKEKEYLLDEIKKAYIDFKNEAAFSPISVCIGELLSNFWAHATEETDTIFAAECSADNFKAVLADNASGIVYSIKKSYGENYFRSDEKALASSLNKGVSSKKNVNISSSHMGFGLFYISEIIKLNKGNLNIWSNMSHLQITNTGRMVVKKSPNWSGTIVEVNLPVSKPLSISSLRRDDEEKYNNLLINWN